MFLLAQTVVFWGFLFQFDLIANIEKSGGVTYKSRFSSLGTLGLHPLLAASVLPKGVDPTVCLVSTRSVVPWLINLWF